MWSGDSKPKWVLITAGVILVVLILGMLTLRSESVARLKTKSWIRHMKVHWLIDADMFAHYRDELVACIRAQGHEVGLIRPPQPPYRWDDVWFIISRCLSKGWVRRCSR